jgi:hypothetical protein
MTGYINYQQTLNILRRTRQTWNSFHSALGCPENTVFTTPVTSLSVGWMRAHARSQWSCKRLGDHGGIQRRPKNLSSVCCSLVVRDQETFEPNPILVSGTPELTLHHAWWVRSSELDFLSRRRLSVFRQRNDCSSDSRLVCYFSMSWPTSFYY